MFYVGFKFLLFFLLKKRENNSIIMTIRDTTTIIIMQSTKDYYYKIVLVLSLIIYRKHKKKQQKLWPFYYYTDANKIMYINKVWTELLYSLAGCPGLYKCILSFRNYFYHITSQPLSPSTPLSPLLL